MRVEYAQVLHAEPVYQTLRATSMVQRCEQSTPVAPAAEPRRGLSRVVGAVKDVLTPAPDKDKDADKDEAAGAPAEGDCRMVPVEREFRRPIAYDVDYVLQGRQVSLATAVRPRQPPADPGVGDPDRAARRQPLALRRPCGVAPCVRRCAAR